MDPGRVRLDSGEIEGSRRVGGPEKVGPDVGIGVTAEGSKYHCLQKHQKRRTH